MAENENLGERNRAYFECVALRLDILQIMQGIMLTEQFPTDSLEKFSSHLPSFVEAMMNFAEAKGVNKTTLSLNQNPLGFKPEEETELVSLSAPWGDFWDDYGEFK